MSKNQYDAPAMEVVEFGKEDIVCVISGNGSVHERAYRRRIVNHVIKAIFQFTR